MEKEEGAGFGRSSKTLTIMELSKNQETTLSAGDLAMLKKATSRFRYLQLSFRKHTYKVANNWHQVPDNVESASGCRDLVWRTRWGHGIPNGTESSLTLEEHLVTSSRAMNPNDEPQDADYSYIPLLSDEVALLILARIPRSEHPKLCCINTRYLTLIESGELSKIRRENRQIEASVIMLASGEHHCWEYSPHFESWRKLPVLPCEPSFYDGDKESFSVGYSLLISGRENGLSSVWRYEFLTNSWHRGPSMITSRCLFASANCGDVAYVAGGLMNKAILDSAEQYDPVDKSWKPLPNMRRRRQRCSGCFMDNKFYVIGGMDDDKILTCGEFYDREKRTWHLIPGMFNAMSSSISQSPPFLAVVDNELYALEPTSSRLKVYLKMSNSWKDLGVVPVRTNYTRGWGVAFKSLGDRLIILGAVGNSEDNQSQGISIFTCRPDPNATDCQWDFHGRTVR
ncbi:F-box/kelch-repeat protein [Nymphaea thermarum]|nr:F-box/kelch-repeat protein [Nymphaea thermarum]